MKVERQWGREIWPTGAPDAIVNYEEPPPGISWSRSEFAQNSSLNRGLQADDGYTEEIVLRLHFDIYDGRSRSGAEGSRCARREAVRTASSKQIPEADRRTAASSRFVRIFDEAPYLSRLSRPSASVTAKLLAVGKQAACAVAPPVCRSCLMSQQAPKQG